MCLEHEAMLSEQIVVGDFHGLGKTGSAAAEEASGRGLLRSDRSQPVRLDIVQECCPGLQAGGKHGVPVGIIDPDVVMADTGLLR